MTSAKTRKPRRHPTGVSFKCGHGTHCDCTMLGCRCPCHYDLDLDESPAVYTIKIEGHVIIEC